MDDMDDFPSHFWKNVWIIHENYDIIYKISPQEVVDMRYVPLYIKTENSLLHSTIRIKELIAFARKNDISVLTITDDNMFLPLNYQHHKDNKRLLPI